MTFEYKDMTLYIDEMTHWCANIALLCDDVSLQWQTCYYNIKYCIVDLSEYDIK